MQRPNRYSAASSPRTNPLRSNNDRDRDDPTSSLDNTMSSGTGGDVSGSDEVSQTLGERLAEEQRGRQKLNQIVQQFFIKGALVIVGSRVTFPPWHKNGQLKQNRWFNVVLNDSEELFGRLLSWKTLDILDARPPPLVIETYLDLSDLTPSQTLVIIDSNGSRWDVAEALNPPQEYSGRPSNSRATGVVLERWTVELGAAPSVIPSEAVYDLPNAYKKAVVLFRSLFTYSRTMPAWRYFRRIAKNPPNSPALKLRYRILTADQLPRTRDMLEMPLSSEPGSVTQKYAFEPSLSPAGPFHVSVAYRDNCDFRVDDSESLLSSQFMASDDQYFRPSLSPRRGQRRHEEPVPGSLPARRRALEEPSDPTQAYGSLSTFHGQGLPGTSPISALRNAQWPGVGPSPTESPPQKLPPNHRTAQGSKSSLRAGEGGAAPPYQRRTSVSFQPFKQGSLASSPASGMNVPVPPSPSNSSLGRGQSQPPWLAQHRNRGSITTLPQQALRTPMNIPNETAIASSASSSPKPASISRYSSSFSNRRNRFSSASAGGPGTGGSSSRTEDGDAGGGNNSSGKGSVSSFTRADTSTPEVGGAGTGAGGSSGSMQEMDDNNLQAYIKLLEQKKELKSFNRTDSVAREANITRTTAALNKYQRMRDTNTQLSDSFSSSMLLHRSSSSSSRQLSAVPPMIADRGGSFESSSPGKPVSPHTPHTPAIPSRLSAGAIDYTNIGGEARRSRSGARPPSSAGHRGARDDDLAGEADAEAIGLQRQASSAIPIPTSPNPRAWGPFARRSSSVAQQHRQAVIDDADVSDLYGLGGLRSASLPNEEGRADLSMSELYRLTAEPSAMIAAGAATEPHDEAAAYGAGDGASEGLPYRQRQTSHRGSGSGANRWRIPSSGASTAHAPGSAPGPSGGRGNRYSYGSRARKGEDDDDEPLLFQMSEIGGGGGRRSAEESRGGGSGGQSSRGRGSGLGEGRGLGADW